MARGRSTPPPRASGRAIPSRRRPRWETAASRAETSERSSSTASIGPGARLPLASATTRSTSPRPTSQRAPSTSNAHGWTAERRSGSQATARSPSSCRAVTARFTAAETRRWPRRWTRPRNAPDRGLILPAYHGLTMAGRKLTEYEKKRSFEKTSEPRGGKRRGRSKGNRFTIQEHHARRLHWDLRLERDGVLASWALPKGVPQDPKENRLAVRTEDHPLEYLEFEGEIPKGEYGAGTMKIWDRGTYEAEKFNDDKVIVTLHGDRARGRYALFQTDGDNWMIHRMDAPEDPTREPMPEHIAPMLATLADLPRNEEKYAFEIKWDGVRAIAYV